MVGTITHQNYVDGRVPFDCITLVSGYLVPLTLKNVSPCKFLLA